MTERKPRSLTQNEVDDWFDDEVTQQFFQHIRVDIDQELQYRLQGGFYHQGEAQKTQEALVRSFAKEEIMQTYGDPQTVRLTLEKGFADE